MNFKFWSEKCLEDKSKRINKLILIEKQFNIFLFEILIFFFFFCVKWFLKNLEMMFLFSLKIFCKNEMIFCVSFLKCLLLFYSLWLIYKWYFDFNLKLFFEFYLFWWIKLNDFFIEFFFILKWNEIDEFQTFHLFHS